MTNANRLWPDDNEAAYRFRSDVLMILRRIAQCSGWNSKQISEYLDISPDRTNDLLDSKVMLFTTDELIGFLNKIRIQFFPLMEVSGEIVCRVMIDEF